MRTVTKMATVVKEIMSVIRVVLYLRVSTEDQAENGSSLEDQRREGERKAHELAGQHGAELQLVVFEDHNGGDLLERPVLEQVRTYIREHKPEYFVCFDPDRFSRSLKIQMIVADEIEDRGTRLVFVLQDYDPADMMSRAFFQFRGLMSELEKAKILDRTSRGKRGARQAGKIPHGLKLFGYNYDTTTKTLVVNDDEAKWVDVIFKWVRDQRLGPDGIAQRLQSAGVPTKRGGRWHRGVVADMLKNTAYIGKVILNRYDFKGLDAQRRLPKERRRVKITPRIRPETEWEIHTIPPIISQDVFEEVQVLRSGYKRQTQKRVGLLSGVAVCGLCGGTIHYAASDVGFLFRCANRYPRQRGSKAPGVPCGQRHQKADQFESAVWNMLEQWLTRPELVEEYVQAEAENDQPDYTEALTTELTTIESQLTMKLAAQGHVLATIARGKVHPQVSDKLLAEMTSEINYLIDRQAQLSERLAAIGKQARNSTAAVQRLEEARETLTATTTTEVRQRLAVLNLQQRQTLIRQILAEVIILPGGVWKPVPVQV